jgi:DNA-binding transcriptional LysR family regulator
MVAVRSRRSDLAEVALGCAKQVARRSRTQGREPPKFKEELHAIEAVIAGQGVGIFSNVLVAHELAAGTLVKALDVSLPGYHFYLAYPPGYPREKPIQSFSTWLPSVI